MNIALCTDENFTIPALVCITSIFENNKNEDCHIYVLTDGISVRAREKFMMLANVYDQDIDVLNIDKRHFEGLAVSDRYPVSMYYRFLLPEMLPSEKIILYLDCDIIVRGSLKPLFDINLNDFALGAVVSQSCDYVKWTNDLKLSSQFFNSGVLLMNLCYWRENDVFSQLIEWTAKSKTDMWLPDQYALNKVLEGKVLYLDYTYNFQERWTYNIEGAYVHYNRWQDIMEAGKDPVIVHYCDAEKPWFVECQHKYKSDFLKYASKHDFVGFKPIIRYGKMYKFYNILDKIGKKIQYWANIGQKKEIKKIQLS